MHVHESQLAQVPTYQGVASICKRCGVPLIFEPGELHAIFTEMRRQGWIV